MEGALVAHVSRIGVALGRALAARLPRERRREMLPPSHKLLRRMVAGRRRWLRERCASSRAAGPALSSHVTPLHERWCARPCARMRARDFVVGGAAASRPPLRRRSGDVVTAGLNSSRVWFGPVPGSL
ncbi:hypothetical protein F511_45702 [Dorcoceras hygrometricum]|uniref:Uncharacterized protein n=1 Tax=Dorcoceras hygrometricum TaxID=472368 RepID=A0A2Z7A2G4_9LAMI|nr:hypothetical protein F511_45702 [Dorcoceras hygrometricum]